MILVEKCNFLTTNILKSYTSLFFECNHFGNCITTDGTPLLSKLINTNSYIIFEVIPHQIKWKIRSLVTNHNEHSFRQQSEFLRKSLTSYQSDKTHHNNQNTHRFSLPHTIIKAFLSLLQSHRLHLHIENCGRTRFTACFSSWLFWKLNKIHL